VNVAIIPARGGSKRIPRKNIKDFHGKPIIAYSIEAAIESKCFDRVIVSTDDQEIAQVAIDYGAEVPFMRDESISDDYATTSDVIVNAVDELQMKDTDLVCCLYATAPFVRCSDLVEGYDLLNKNSLDYVFSATEYPFPIQRAFKLNSNKCVEMFQPEHLNTRSQDLELAYHDAGQFYWGIVEAFRLGKPIFANCSKPLILPRKRVQDIDTPEDWEFAEAMFKVVSQL
jgi:N-acylneuraminate cytidylyltransferase